MSRAEPVILTNMCMVTDGRGNVLMQDRADPAGRDWFFRADTSNRGNRSWPRSRAKFRRRRA